MSDILLFALPLTAPILGVFLVVTILTPSLRWPIGFILALAVALIGMWIFYRIAASRPGSGGRDLAFASMFFQLFTFAFVIAVGVYAAGVMWWKSREEERRQSETKLQDDDRSIPPF